MKKKQPHENLEYFADLVNTFPILSNKTDSLGL